MSQNQPSSLVSHLTPTSHGFRPYNPYVQPPPIPAARHLHPQQSSVSQGFHGQRQQVSVTPQSYGYHYAPTTIQGPPPQTGPASVPPTLATAAPPPAPQARPPTLYQDLLSSLDSLYEQQSGPGSVAGPDLHLMQPADPYQLQLPQVQSGRDQNQADPHAVPPQHQQPEQLRQDQQQGQVRDELSDSE